MSPVDLRALVREIPDFPQEGILFKDITPPVLDASGLDDAVADFVHAVLEYAS